MRNHLRGPFEAGFSRPCCISFPFSVRGFHLRHTLLGVSQLSGGPVVGEHEGRGSSRQIACSSQHPTMRWWKARTARCVRKHHRARATDRLLERRRKVATLLRGRFQSCILNYHRPCGFVDFVETASQAASAGVVDRLGDYRTPCEKLLSLDKDDELLDSRGSRCGVSGAASGADERQSP